MFTFIKSFLIDIMIPSSYLRETFFYDQRERSYGMLLTWGEVMSI